MQDLHKKVEELAESAGQDFIFATTQADSGHVSLSYTKGQDLTKQLWYIATTYVSILRKKEGFSAKQACIFASNVFSRLADTLNEENNHA